MFLEGKFVPPAVPEQGTHLQKFHSAFRAPRLYIHAPPGSLSAASLAKRISRDHEPLLWFRCAAHDADPATFLLGLICVLRNFDPELGSECLDRIHQLQWLRRGWADLYAGLAREIHRAAVGPATLVIEHAGKFQQNISTQLFFYRHFLPGLTENIRLVLVAEDKPLTRWLPSPTEIFGEKHLGLDIHGCRDLYQAMGVDLSQRALRRLHRLTGGRYQLLEDMAALTRSLGRPLLQDCLTHSRSLEEFLTRLTRDAVQMLLSADRSALSLLVYSGYNHPLIQEAALNNGEPVKFPPVQQLAAGWQRLPRLWREALIRAGLVQTASHRAALVRAGEYLCNNQAVLNGIELLIAAAAYTSAAQNLENNRNELLYLGQWENFSGLLSRLEQVGLTNYPGLLSAQGIIQACQGNSGTAVRYLEQSGQSALKLENSHQACENLTALAALKEKAGEYDQAFQHAVRARELAQAAGLEQPQAWAEYYLGNLMVRRQNYLSAREHFDRSLQLAKNAGDKLLQICLQSVIAMVARQVELADQRQQHHREFRNALAAEREQAESLRQAIRFPAAVLPSLGEGKQVLPFALVVQYAYPAEMSETRPITGWRDLGRRLISQVRRWFGRVKLRPVTRSGNPRPLPRPEALTAPSLTSKDMEAPAPAPQINLQKNNPTVIKIDRNRSPAGHPAGKQPEAIPVTGEAADRRTMAIYFLGNFRLGVEDTLLEDIPGGQVGSLLKYLLYHRQRQIPREELIDLFWPEADPDLARNRLNVALSHVRQVFRPRIEGDVVVYQEGKYSLTSDLDVWTDIGEFESSLEDAWRHTQSGSSEEAIRALEVAANLYQGDFLADDPYEEWTLFTRERVRLAYLDALYQLGCYYFEQKRYAASAAICQSILNLDNCREDVHCLLMRCYARQEQFHLGLRQYQTCVDALRHELDIEPAPTTLALYHRLRRREHTQPGVTA